jgi:catechol-2,3-dioxygenase
MLKHAPIVPYIPAADLKRARKFYEDVIGLVPKDVTDGSVRYDCGGTWVLLYMSGGAGTSRASQAFWQVRDLEAEMAELRSRGLEFEEYDFPGVKTENGIADAGGALAAWFTDSEGNIMAIVQNK